MVSAADALAGRREPIVIARDHLVLGVPLSFQPTDAEVAFVALGCFWGAEREFYSMEGVLCTAVGYQGGFTPNPTYEEVCSGRTGHAETVKVVFDPQRISYADVLARFFEHHDPTQGFRQGADVGTQYRSAIFVVDDAQRETALMVAKLYDERLRAAGYGPVTTEITEAGAFYLAEEYHQQYLEANPQGYCGLGGTGVSCPIGVTGI